MTADKCHHDGDKMMGRLSGCLGDDKDAHQKDHDEEDPHEKPIHNLGNLLPLCYLNTRSSLLAETVGDVLDVLYHLRKRQIDEPK